MSPTPKPFTAIKTSLRPIPPNLSYRPPSTSLPIPLPAHSPQPGSSSELSPIQSRRETKMDNKQKMAHDEKHSDYGDVVRDVIIGFADGLTVPFALTAGLSSLGSARLVIIGGLAELFSGAISMGLGAYLASVTERDHYKSEELRERNEVETRPDDEKEEIYEIMGTYGISREATRSLVEQLSQNNELWVQFMMDFELKLEKRNVSRAWISAATMGVAYFIGGLVPMIPYFAMKNVTHALFVSIAITVVVLLIFGFIKNYVTVGTKRSGAYGAIQTLLIGVLAAGTSYGIVRAIDSKNPVNTGKR